MEERRCPTEKKMPEMKEDIREERRCQRGNKVPERKDDIIE